MKKLFLHIVWLLPLLVLALVSCEKDSPVQSPKGSGDGRLHFSCVEPLTKAGVSGTDPGVEELKENLLASIDVYFYPNGGTGSDAVYHKRLTPGAQLTYTTDIDFTQSQIRALFNGSTSCEVYAIANIAENLLPASLSGTSLTALKNITLSSVFGSAAGSSHVQTSFVMDGYNTVTLTSLSQTTVATGQVDMYRIASKLTLLIHVQDSIHLATTYKDEYNVIHPAYEIWRPMLDKDPSTGNCQVEAYLENGCSKTKLGVRLDPDTFMTNTDNDASVLFKYSNNRMKYDSGTTVTESEAARWTFSDYKAGRCTLAQVGQPSGSTVNVKYMYSDAAYTYPAKWTEGAGNEPFYKLVLPWQRSDTLLVHNNGLANAPVVVSYPTAQKQYYYKIVFPNPDFRPNNHYKYKLNVGILGSETDDAMITMACTYMVAGWQNKTEVLEEAEVGNARYLSVGQNAYTMYNEADLKIPFISSDDCEIVSATWQKQYFGTSTSDKTRIGDKYYTTGDASSWLGISGQNIVFYHDLDNVMSTDMDVAPYTITFTIRHQDDHTYSKEVTIIQYPAIYIDQKEGGDVFIDGYFGYVTIGGTTYKSVNYSSHSYGNNHVMTPYRTLSTSVASMKNLTRISVSVFDSGSNSFSAHTGNVPYIIGDPREASGWSAGDLIDYGVRGTANGTTYNLTTTSWGAKAGQIMVGTTNPQIIAPSIYVASYWCSMNANDPLSFDNAKKRCATYQEAGYPAGRWRLPTEAEVYYIEQLQEKDHIATLFNSDYHYWTSSGYAYRGRDDNYKTGTATDPGARCVYDVWYWGDTPMSADTFHPNPTN